MLNEILILIGAYLIGSIPFGLILTVLAGHGDIRKIGSGNIGTTNVLRTGSKWLALLTLVADGGKVVIAILLANKLGYHQDYLIGVISSMGHLFPVWLKFKGGKGVASFFGLSILLFPKIALLMLFSWVITFVISRYSSLSAIIAVIVGAAALIVTQPMDWNLLLILSLMVIIIIKHKENIIRLINGKESSFKKKSK